MLSHIIIKKEGKSYFFLRKCCGDKSAISCTNYQAGDEETAGHTGSVSPAGKKEVQDKENEESW